MSATATSKAEPSALFDGLARVRAPRRGGERWKPVKASSTLSSWFRAYSSATRWLTRFSSTWALLSLDSNRLVPASFQTLPTNRQTCKTRDVWARGAASCVGRDAPEQTTAVAISEDCKWYTLTLRLYEMKPTTAVLGKL